MADDRTARRKKLKELEEGITPKGAQSPKRTKKVPPTPTGIPKGTKTTGNHKRTQPKVPPTASEARNRKDPREVSRNAIMKARTAASTRRDGPAVTKMREEVETYKAELEALKSENSSLKATHSELSEQHEATTEALKSTSETLGDLQQEHDTTVAESSANIKEYHEMLDDTRSKLEASHADLETTLHQQLALTQENATHKASIKALKSQNKIIMGAAEDNGSAADQSSESLIAAHEAAREAQENLTKLEQDLDEVKAKYEASNLELEITKTHLDESTQQITQLSSSAAANESSTTVELESSKAMVRELRKQLEAARDAHSQAETEAANLRIKSSETEFTIQSLELKVKQSEEERTRLSSRLKSDQENTVFVEEYESAQAKIKQLQEQINGFGVLETEVKEHRARASVSTTLQIKLQAEFEALQAENDNLRDKYVTSTQATKDALKGKLLAIQEKNKLTQELAIANTATRPHAAITVDASKSNELKALYEEAQQLADTRRADVIRLEKLAETQFEEIASLEKQTKQLSSELDAATELLVSANSDAAHVTPPTPTQPPPVETVVDTKAAEDLAALQVEFERVNSAKLALADFNEISQTEITHLQKQIKQLQSELDAATDMLVSSESATAAPDRSNEIDALTAANAKLTKDVADLTGANAKVSKHASDINTSAASKDSEIKRLQKKITQLQSELDAATEMVIASESAAALVGIPVASTTTPDRSEEVDSLSAANTKLSNDLSKLNAAATSKDSEINKLGKKISQLQSELDAATELVVSSGNFIDESPALSKSISPQPTADNESYNGFTSPMAKMSPVKVEVVVAKAPSPEPKVAVQLKKVEAPVVAPVDTMEEKEESKEPVFNVPLRRSRTEVSVDDSSVKSGGENELGAMFRRRASTKSKRPQSMFIKPSEPKEKEEEPQAATFDDLSLSVRERSKSVNKRSSSGVRGGGSFKAPVTPKCAFCGTAAYAMERVEADGKHYHKKCFKCCNDGKLLSLGNYAAMNDKLYCKPCFMKMFKSKGNYDEGFGETQHKMKWVKDAAGNDTEA